MVKKKGLFVSVIVPTFNREKKIKKCLDKLVESTFDMNKAEIIVVDDLSKDDTSAVVRTYQKEFPNFVFIQREKNSGGASIPRNDGLAAAQGEWILFVDSDDYITENSLQDAYDLAEKDPAMDMVCMPYFRSEGSSRAISRSAFSNTEPIWGFKFEETKLFNSLNAVGKLIKRKIIQENGIEFPEGIKVREDNWFMMKVYAAVKNIGILGNSRNYYYTDEKDEVSLSQTGTPPRDAVKIYLAAYDFIMGNEDISMERKIDLLSIYMNRYEGMIKRGTHAPLRLRDKMIREIPLMIENEYLGESARAFLKELVKIEKNDATDFISLKAGLIFGEEDKGVKMPSYKSERESNRKDTKEVPKQIGKNLTDAKIKEPTVLSFTSNKLISQKPTGYRQSDWGTGHLLLYLAILDDLQEGKLRPEQEVTFSKRAASLGKNLRGTNSVEGEKRYLSDLLNQAISLNAPDCILALCTVYGSVDAAMKRISRLGTELKVSVNSRLIASGRLTKSQASGIYDYYRIALAYMSLARKSFEYIKNRGHIIKGKHYRPQSVSDVKGFTLGSLYWGTMKNECMIFKEINGEVCCSIAINARSYIHASELVVASFHNTSISDNTIQELQTPIVNYLADTYFGEFYTEQRKKKNQEDALTKYGYHYTLEKISKKISDDDFSIVTYEGVLIKPEEKALNKRKVYYLGGDKKETINEFKNRNFRLVNLANNHAKDYGSEALIDTINSFKEVGIMTMGAGRNIREATKPIILKNFGKEVALFSGYWYRAPKDIEFDFYATSRDGVASLDGILLDEIKKYRNKNPDTYIAVIAHWGADFVDVTDEQRKIAKWVVDAGADLILGSGPHKIQETEEINGVKVFYSLGNGAFNSNGWGLMHEGNLPYGYFIKWNIFEEKIRLFPFWNYNPDTFWQPKFIDKEDIDKVDSEIRQLNNNNVFSSVMVDDDDNAFYEIDVSKRSIVKDGNSWKEWLMKNIRGRFLNEEISDNLSVDYATASPDRIEPANSYHCLYVSLSSDNLKGLVGNPKWNPQHGNEYLLKSGMIDRVSIILTDKPIAELEDQIPQYIVEDSLEASMILIGYLDENFSGDWITITGSAGKTSTRNMLTYLFNDESLVSNIGNSNLKVPNYDLSLALASSSSKAIFESAAAAFNNVKYGSLSYAWSSDVAIFTSFGTAHAVTGIQRNLEVKSGIFLGVKNGGIAIVNGDIEEKYLWKIIKSASQQNVKVRLYSLTDTSAYCWMVKKKVERDETTIRINLNGKYVDFSLSIDSDGQILNAMAAIMTVEALGLDIYEYSRKIKDYKNLPRILEQKTVKNDSRTFTLIDDTHNSSILAIENGIKLFNEKKKFFSGNGILVLGEVADLGDVVESEHQKLIPLLKSSRADYIILQGDGFRNIATKMENVIFCEDKEEISSKIKDFLNEDALVFVKGSSLGKFKTVADEIASGDI